jgi:hypothetical protein
MCVVTPKHTYATTATSNETAANPHANRWPIFTNKTSRQDININSLVGIVVYALEVLGGERHHTQVNRLILLTVTCAGCGGHAPTCASPMSSRIDRFQFDCK